MYIYEYKFNNNDITKSDNIKHANNTTTKPQILHITTRRRRKSTYLKIKEELEAVL